MEAAVRDILNETASNPAYFTSADIRESLNDGLEELSDATEWYERTTPVQLLTKRTYYDLRGYEAPILTVNRIFLPSPVNWLVWTTTRELDGMIYDIFYYPQWEGTAGTIRWCFLRSLFWLGVHPQPSTDTDVARVSHTSIPPPLLQDGDSPDFPEEFHLALVEYAAYDLLVQDSETVLALRHWAEYQEGEKDLKDVVEQRQQIDRLVRMSEEGPSF